MLRNAGKVFILSLLVISLAAPVFATTARVNSLAGAGNYINDDSNIFNWYGVLPSYANLVMAELGTWYQGVESMPGVADQALGLTYSCGEDGKYGTWGMFLLRNVTDNSFFVNSPISMGAEGFGDIGVSVPVNKLALMWGIEFDKFSIGLSFTRSDWEHEFDTQPTDTTVATSKTSSSYTTLGGGIRADVQDNLYLDLSATMGLGGYDILGSETGIDKRLSLDFAGRLFYEWKDNITVVPVAEFFRSNYARKNMLEPNGSKVNAFSIGTALDIDVNTNNLLIFGAQIDYYNWKYSNPGTRKDEDTVWDLPLFFLALESNVKPWLTARVGATKALTQSTYTATGTNDVALDDQITSGEFDFFLGLGFHVAEFDIDAEIGKDTPFNIGYWLTGYSQWETAPITRLSATYHF